MPAERKYHDDRECNIVACEVDRCYYNSLGRCGYQNQAYITDRPVKNLHIDQDGCCSCMKVPR